MPLLPNIEDDRSLERWREDESAFSEATQVVARRHGLGRGEVVAMTSGSVPVFGVGDEFVVKFFPKFTARNFQTESLMLRALEGALPVPTPAWVGDGAFEEFRYVAMGRVRGRPLREVKKDLDRDSLGRVAHQVGEAVLALSELVVDELVALSPPFDSWLEAQADGCVARHRKFGLAPEWLDQIPSLLEGAQLHRREQVSKPMHTEIMCEHVFVQEGPKGLEVSGLIDFEPAAVGDTEYELASVGLFLTEGDPAMFRSFLRGFGRPDVEPELSKRALAFALLHRYSHLPRILGRMPKTPRTFADIATYWWGC